jgi:hypothetical protein
MIATKDSSVWFKSNFHQLNLRIKHKPFPLPRIKDLILELEGCQLAISLDLNKRNYSIEFSTFSKSLFTIILPWANYE